LGRWALGWRLENPRWPLHSQGLAGEHVLPIGKLIAKCEQLERGGLHSRAAFIVHIRIVLVVREHDIGGLPCALQQGTAGASASQRDSAIDSTSGLPLRNGSFRPRAEIIR